MGGNARPVGRDGGDFSGQRSQCLALDAGPPIRRTCWFEPSCVGLPTNRVVAHAEQPGSLIESIDHSSESSRIYGRTRSLCPHVRKLVGVDTG